MSTPENVVRRLRALARGEHVDRQIADVGADANRRRRLAARWGTAARRASAF